MGEAWVTYNADAQCTLGPGGGEEAQTGREIVLCLNFSCLALKCEFFISSVHCSPALSEHLYDYFQVRHLSLFHQGIFLRFYLVLLFGAYSCFFMFLDCLCWFLCIR